MKKTLLILLLLPLGLFSKNEVVSANKQSSVTIDFKGQTQNATLIFNHPAITSHTQFTQTINEKGTIILEATITEGLKIVATLSFTKSLSNHSRYAGLFGRLQIIEKINNSTNIIEIRTSDIDLSKNINMEKLTYKVAHNTLIITIPVEV